ncbi:MAG: hypothetical protein E3J72_10870 [Planctomycetota bacterium]|nr:MAG: hypothetical protein E3J72_10870 [Planctomycetota bacterium]
MNKCRLFFTAALIAVALSIAMDSAMPDDESPTAKQIGRHMKKYLGEELTFRDEIGYIFKRSRKWEGFFRFDTEYVPCRISDEMKDEIELIKEMMRREVEPNWIALTGNVVIPGKCPIEYVFDVSGATRPVYPRDDLKKDEPEGGQ